MSVAPKEDIVFGIKEPQPLERASIRVVPLDRRQMELFFPSLEVGRLDVVTLGPLDIQGSSFSSQGCVYLCSLNLGILL